MAINFPDNRDQLVPPQPSGDIQTGDVYVYQGTTYIATVLGDGSVRWDAAVSAGNDGYVLKVGDTMTGQLTLPGGGAGKNAATVDQITNAIPAALWSRAVVSGQGTLSPATGTDYLEVGGDGLTVVGRDVGVGMHPNPPDAFGGHLSVADTITANGNVQMGSLNSGPLAGFRNKLRNPFFAVFQRSSPVNVGASYRSTFGADGWTVRDSGSTGGTTTLTAGFPGASIMSTYMSQGNAGHTDFFYLRQKIESVTTLAGQTATLTLQLQSSVAFSIEPTLQQVFGTGGSALEIINSAEGAQAVATGGIRTLTWTFNVPSIAGKTVDTTDDCLVLVISSTATVNGTIQWVAAQLEPGPVSTPMEVRPIQTELALCQRYYRVSGVDSPPAATPRCLIGINGVKSSNSAARMTYDATGMRTVASPTVNVVGPINDLAISVADGTSALSSISGISGRENTIFFVANFINSAATNSSPAQIVQAGGSVKLAIDVEL